MAVEKKGDCPHRHLELLPQPPKRLQCQHCHLTITAEELAGGFCPECYDSRGEKRYDFDEIKTAQTTATRYRCEDCGAIIEIRKDQAAAR